jgi:hypothetical protein
VAELLWLLVLRAAGSLLSFSTGEAAAFLLSNRCSNCPFKAHYTACMINQCGAEALVLATLLLLLLLLLALLYICFAALTTCRWSVVLRAAA